MYVHLKVEPYCLLKLWGYLHHWFYLWDVDDNLAHCWTRSLLSVHAVCPSVAILQQQNV